MSWIIVECHVIVECHGSLLNVMLFAFFQYQCMCQKVDVELSDNTFASHFSNIYLSLS